MSSNLGPTAQHLACQILELERLETDSAPAAAAERALQKLRQPLGRLVGVDGFDALVTRAQHIAVVRQAPPARPGQPHVVLAHVISLLVAFIGAGLTASTLRSIWPGLHVDESPTHPEEPPP